MSTTTNYHWVKPTNGGDADTWGTELNATLDNIDSTVKTVADSVPAPPAAPALLKHDNVALSATFLTLDMSAWLGYNRIQILLNKVNPGLASTGAGVQFSTDKGVTWLGSGYKWTLANFGPTYIPSSDVSTGDTTQIRFQDAQAFIHGSLELSLSGSPIMGSHIAGGANTRGVWIGGSGNSTPGVNAIKVYTIGGTVVAGSYDVIGYL